MKQVAFTHVHKFSFKWRVLSVVLNNTHTCARLARGSSHETGEGQVTCWYRWGKASCLKNRTAFYPLALPGSLSSNLPCLEIPSS